MKQRDRFIQSKCDRCGKTTPAKQNGIGDLFTLPHEYAEPLSDSGDFCVACCERYDEANWLAWFKEHRTETTADAALVAEMSAMRAELLTAKEDNAALLIALREIDSSEWLPPRVQCQLDRIRQAEHPGRALMAELTRRMSELEQGNEQLLQLHHAIEALPDSIYEPGCECKYCAAIDAARLALR